MTTTLQKTERETPGASPASFALSRFGWRGAVSAALLVALLFVAYALHGAGQAGLSLSLIFGAAFGIVLQRSRFCFFCNFREWYDDGDARGLIGIIVALAVGVVGYTVVFGSWLPDASTGRLPPDAFIGPVSYVLVLAGLAFGAGMAISGSCVSAHLYRLGEGSPTSPFALIGTVVGFILGFLSWNTLYLGAVAEAPSVWLPRWLGYAGALLAALVVLAAVAWLLSLRARNTVSSPAHDDQWRKIFVERWPAWIGGAIVGVLGTAAYLRVGPLGVTAEIGGRARQAGTALGIVPQRLEGLDTLRGCITVVRDALLSNNGVFIIALVVAAFAAAFTAGQFKPSWPSGGQITRGLTGGVLLGWGAMTGLGCTVGTFLSGVSAGALSGWIFGAAIFASVAATLFVGRRVGLLSKPTA
ncbi:MAG: YeeE/YedE family protein [Pseudolabrys sp.]|nr:YeeE/YedE family protein [Pseudolabrys sp.]